MPVQSRIIIAPGFIKPANAETVPKGPMTSKQVKKSYKERNAAPKMSRAELRKMEKEELENQRKEFEREKRLEREKMKREKKKAKEEEERMERKRNKIPEKSKWVRPSQGRITGFVVLGKRAAELDEDDEDESEQHANDDNQMADLSEDYEVEYDQHTDDDKQIADLNDSESRLNEHEDEHLQDEVEDDLKPETKGESMESSELLLGEHTNEPKKPSENEIWQAVEVDTFDESFIPLSPRKNTIPKAAQPEPSQDYFAMLDAEDEEEDAVENVQHFPVKPVVVDATKQAVERTCLAHDAFLNGGKVAMAVEAPAALQVMETPKRWAKKTPTPSPDYFAELDGIGSSFGAAPITPAPPVLKAPVMAPPGITPTPHLRNNMGPPLSHQKLAMRSALRELKQAANMAPLPRIPMFVKRSPTAAKRYGSVAEQSWSKSTQPITTAEDRSEASAETPSRLSPEILSYLEDHADDFPSSSQLAREMLEDEMQQRAPRVDVKDRAQKTPMGTPHSRSQASPVHFVASMSQRRVVAVRRSIESPTSSRQSSNASQPKKKRRFFIEKPEDVEDAVLYESKLQAQKEEEMRLLRAKNDRKLQELLANDIRASQEAIAQICLGASQGARMKKTYSAVSEDEFDFGSDEIREDDLVDVTFEQIVAGGT